VPGNRHSYRDDLGFMLAIPSALQTRSEEYLRNLDREVGVPIAYRFTSRSQLIFRCPLSSGSSSLPRVRLTLFADEFHASEINGLLLSSTLPGSQKGDKCPHIASIFLRDAIFDFPQFL
jgi:hypothetical protein